MELGTVEGAVNTEKFHFEAHKDVEKFDFIAVKANTDEAEWMLAQINEVEKKPLDDSEKVDEAYKTVAEANIIGYRNKGLLKKPRSVIEPDSIVYRADQDLISETLGLDQNGLYMGQLLSDPDIDIFLDPEDLYKHFAVLAKTGAGKSYSTAVMIEELLAKDYPVLIIDPHGEYHSLSRPNDISEEDMETYHLEPESFDAKSYSTNTELNREARQLTFSSRNMSAKEIQQVVPTNLTNSQLGVLYTALKELKKRESYTLDDVIETCEQQDSKAKWNLINMLEAVRDSGLFEKDPTTLEDLVEPGRATIVNLRGVDPEVQETVVFKLSKELFEMRKRGKLEPFFMVMEEAHNFVPEKGMGKAVSSDILRKIASEGRKFGLGIGVISQRPANVAKNILSQCNTQLIMRVTNPNDLSAISRSFEGVTSEVEDSITSLPPGVGLVLGKEHPIMTDIRVRKSLHGGGMKDVSEEEGIEKGDEVREDDLAEKAEAAEPQIEPEENLIEAFEPDMDLGDLPEGADDVTTAYYPIYIVETPVGRLAIDGEDGAIKARDLNLTDQADSVLDAIKDHDMRLKELSELTSLDEETISMILDRLREYNLVAKDDDLYSYTGVDLFARGIGESDAGREKVIEPDIDETEAKKIAKEELGKKDESIRLVYYPYYRTGNRVFDAVLEKEV